MDAFATLLRPRGSYIEPDASFLVQFKTVGERRVPRQGAISMSWLRQLRMPFWIVTVDAKHARIRIYSTLSGSRHPNAPQLHEVAFLLGGRAGTRMTDGRLECSLTQPLFEYSFQEALQRDFGERAFETLQPILQHEHRNLGLLLDLNRLEFGDGGSMTLHDPARLKEELEAARPAVQHLLALTTTNSERWPVAGALLVVADFFHQNGVEVDPRGVYRGLLMRMLAASTQARDLGKNS